MALVQLVVGEGEPWLQAPAEAQVFNLLLQKLSLLGLHHFLSIFRQVFCELRAARCDGFFRSISKAIGNRRLQARGQVMKWCLISPAYLFQLVGQGGL